MNKIIITFVVTFLSLALIGSILYFGFNIDLIQWYWTLLIAIIMFGVPIYVYLKNRKL